MKIYLANPRGFCAGVERAINIVEEAIIKFGAPIYVRHEIVHNKHVVDGLKQKGAIFVKELDEVPREGIVIFSAHGVSKKIEESAESYNLQTIDATCPLVKKVHYEAKKNEEKGKELLLIGHPGHPEVEGTSGQLNKPVTIISDVKDAINYRPKQGSNLAYVTQTTLSMDDTKEIINVLRSRFPDITGPGLKDICYATQNRQNAVKDLAKICDLILVIGSQNSSNSNRLKDLAQENGRKSYLINDSSEINVSWFEGVGSIGITAGASASENIVREVISFIQSKFDCHLEQISGITEDIYFKNPPMSKISRKIPLHNC